MTAPGTFPDTATLHAVLVRTESGHYRATLTLPGGQTQTVTSDELDRTRSQVIDVARAYLAAEVGHPGRLQVEDPEGRWLLGVPHDGGDLVPLQDPPSAPPRTPRPAVREPVLPSRPAVPGRRRAMPRASGRRPRSPSSRRVGALTALAAGVLALAGIVELTHNTSSPRRTPAAVRSAHHRNPAHLTTASPPTTAPASTATSVSAAPPPAAPPTRRAALSAHPKTKPRRLPRTRRHHPSLAKRAATVHHAHTPAPTTSTTPVPSPAPTGSGSSRSRGDGGVRLPVPSGPPPL